MRSSRTPESRPLLRVHWTGDFTGSGSIAQVNVELARRIAGRTSLSIDPAALADASGLDPELAPLVRVPDTPPHIALQHSSRPSVHKPDHGKWVWMQAWEYGAALPVEWLSSMRSQADAVLTYSDWNAQHMIAAGLSPQRVHSVALGIDLARFHPEVPAADLPTTKRFRFLSISGHLHRKGIDVLLRAYRRAFSSDDDVALVLKEFNPEGRYEPLQIQDLMHRFSEPGAPEIVRLPTDIPPQSLPSIYTACDILVHPYRAEGFGLPLAEAMACGRLVIATDKGGPKQFLRHDNAVLLPSHLLFLPRLTLGERRLSNVPHYQEPSESALVDALRHGFDNRDSWRDRATAGSAAIRSNYSWDHAADRLLDRLNAILAQPAVVVRTSAAPDPGEVLERAERFLGETSLDAAATEFQRAFGLSNPPHRTEAEQRIATRALIGLARVAERQGNPEIAEGFLDLARSGLEAAVAGDGPLQSFPDWLRFLVGPKGPAAEAPPDE